MADLWLCRTCAAREREAAKIHPDDAKGYKVHLFPTDNGPMSEHHGAVNG